MVGRDRIDLAVDPPPDLVIEIDVTSTTALQAYEALQVPELWRYHNRALQIFVLRDRTYVPSPRSPTFPHIPVVEGVTQFVEMSRTAGTAPALRAFRQWVREHIQP